MTFEDYTIFKFDKSDELKKLKIMLKFCIACAGASVAYLCYDQSYFGLAAVGCSAFLFALYYLRKTTTDIYIKSITLSKDRKSAEIIVGLEDDTDVTIAPIRSFKLNPSLKNGAALGSGLGFEVDFKSMDGTERGGLMVVPDEEALNNIKNKDLLIDVVSGQSEAVIQYKYLGSR